MTDRKLGANIISGAIFIVIAAFFFTEAIRMPLGTAFRMGPGFMPAALAVILAVLGSLVILSGLRQAAPSEKRNIPWRGMAMILFALGIFAAFFRELGLVPLVLTCTFITSLASRKNTVAAASGIAGAMAVISYLTFKVGLGISLPTFGTWFAF